MKLKFKFIAFFVTFTLLFTTCALLNGDEKMENEIKVIVEPLIKTKWGGADIPYRMLNPKVDGQYTVLGCIARTTAQVMKFHNHPVRGSGQSEAYITNTRKFEIPSVNFNFPYDWNNMLNTYPNATSGTEQQRIAVATLMYHVAVSLKTDFNIGYSGQGGPFMPLTTYFGYDRNIERHQRNFYNNDAEWEAILKEQLNAGLPIIYYGLNSQGGGGHAFVLDGYDNAGKYHMNMSYGGTADGWYSLNNIKYGGQDHSYNQDATINIKPNQGGTGTNRMALMVFTPSKNTVSQNEQFNVTIQMKGVGFVSSGQAGVALVDNSNNIVAVIGNRSNPERNPGGTTGVWDINCTVPTTVSKGSYKLRIVIRPTGWEWQIVTLSEIGKGIPNSIDFIVR